MTVNVSEVLAEVTSHAQRLGVFDRVNAHEPKAAPGKGLWAAVWADRVVAVGRASGLNSTSALMIFNVRVGLDMVNEPQDMIDESLINAVDLLFEAYNGDFSLGGLVRSVDVFGANGTPLQAQAGYLQQGGKVFRVVTLSLPLVINDCWDQVS